MLCALLLTACALRPPALVWPEGIPPQSVFRAEWRQTPANQSLQSEDNYLLWVTRFYEGFSGVPGWLDMTEQVLERLPASEHEWVAARLLELGGRIGREWAKDNAVRVLNTRSAAVWRDALLEALARDELEAYLDRLSQDVDALLAGELTNDLIRFERYYVDEFDF
jgi:hypothetical protein